MFRPPDKSAAGVLQFRQYVRWVESVADCSLLDASVDDDDSPEHRRIAAARMVCDRLRDGRVLNAMLSHVELAVGHRSNGPAAKGGRQAAEDAVRLLSVARRRFSTIMTEEELSSAVRFSGVVLDFCIHTDHDVPPIEALYGGNYEAFGFILFHAFHVAVVRERFRLAPSMILWYRRVAQLYGLEFSIPIACDCDAQLFDATFQDGLLWILAMHNTLGVDVDLSTVYRRPATPEQYAANLSFAYCLMELHDIFSYFPVLDDLVERRNTHFLFMQCFHVYQRLEMVALQPLQSPLTFAPETVVQRPKATRVRAAPLEATSGGQVATGSQAPRKGTPPPRRPPPKRRAQSPALTKGLQPDAEHHRSFRTPVEHRMPTPRRTAPTAAPHPVAVPTQTAAQPLTFECKIASGAPSGLEMRAVRIAIVGGSKEVDIHMDPMSATCPTYRLPSLLRTGNTCKRGRGSTVVLTYSEAAPRAPPPYNLSSAPALSLFFADAHHADTFASAAQ